MGLLDTIFGRTARESAAVTASAASATNHESPITNHVEAASATKADLRVVIQPHARARWTAVTARQLTPERIEQIMRGVVSGSFVAQWELFDLMEDTWPRLKKNLNELKRAVQRVDMMAVAYSEGGAKPSKRAEDKANFLARAMLATRAKKTAGEKNWERSIYDMCDAIGKGVCVQEILWEARDGMIVPRAFQWVHPRHYGYAHTSPELQLNVDGEGAVYTEFPPDKFLIATFETKTGHLLTSALLRSLATVWIGANFSYEWALNLAQMFGIPIRWATYDPTNPKLLDDICDMLQNMGSAGWGAFPAGTTLELKEAIQRAADNPQAFLMELADIAADILILGQTLTTSQGSRGSQALGTVHSDVRADVIEFCGSWAAEELSYEFVPALMRLNFGDNDEDPWLISEIERPKDGKAMADRDDVLINKIGMQVSKTWLYERHDAPMPEGDDEVFEPAKQEKDTTEKTKSTDDGKNKAETDAKLVTAKSATDKVVDFVLEDLTGIEARWLGGVRPYFAQLVEMARNEQVTDAQFLATIEAAEKQIPDLFDRIDSQALQTSMENAMAAGLINGVSDGYRQRRRKETTT